MQSEPGAVTGAKTIFSSVGTAILLDVMIKAAANCAGNMGLTAAMPGAHALLRLVHRRGITAKAGFAPAISAIAKNQAALSRSGPAQERLYYQAA